MAATQTITVPRAQKSLATFFTLLILFHFIDIMFGRLAGDNQYVPNVVILMLYIIVLPLVGALGAFKSEQHGKTLKAYIFLIVMGAFSWLIPFLAFRLISDAGLSKHLVMTVIMFFPVYPLLIFFTHEEQLGRFWKLFMWAWLVAWLLSSIYANPEIFQSAADATLQFGGTADGNPVETLKTQYLRTKDGIVRLWTGTAAKPRQFLNESIAFATGDAYTARVDRNAKTDIGVTLGDIQLAQPTFTTADRVGYFTTIEAQTIETILKLRVNCTAKDDKNKLISSSLLETISPDTSKEPIEIAQQETIDVDCVYRAGAIRPGRPTLTVGAEFDTFTLSYLRTYFMDRDRLRELRSAKIDPFKQYGIKDRKPVTIYTDGPISVGMGFSTPPVGIDTDSDEFTGTLGITIKNVWPGQIKNVSFIAVFIPKGFSMTELGGGKVTQVRCSDLEVPDWCDDTTSNLYKIELDISSAIPKEKSITARARLKAPRSEYDTILGTTPISAKLFKAAVSYTYLLEKSRTVVVKGAEAGTIAPTTQVVKLESGPTISEKTGNNAVISFTTDNPAPTEIKYCRGASVATCSPLINSNPSVKKEHSYNITGLLPNALYSYDIFAFSTACANGRCKLGNQQYTFTTEATS